MSLEQNRIIRHLLPICFDITSGHMLRWAVNVAKWEPSMQEFIELLGYVQHEEQKRIRRFHFFLDKKRALVGRLLLRAAISRESELKWDRITLKRTPKNKPYWNMPADYKGADDFQVNISHHGDWVILASIHGKMLGCDVMSIEIPGRKKDMNNFFRDMRNCFTEGEWRIIRSRQGERAQLSQFFSFWTLKESVVKATGEGLGFDLQRVEFYHASNQHNEEFSPYKVRIYPDQKGSSIPVPQPDWTLEHTRLDDEHIASVASGPLEWQLDRPNASTCAVPPPAPCPYEVKTVQDLLHMANGLRALPFTQV